MRAIYDCDVFIRRASCDCDKPAAVLASINARASRNSPSRPSYAALLLRPLKRQLDFTCGGLLSLLQEGSPREAIQGLIDGITLEPDGEQMRITLKGNLAGMLRLAQQNKRPSETDDLLDQIMLVAGAGFEPATFGL